MADFSKLITNWYKLNHRQLPWRNTTDSYKIWLSEIILQQTRVAQGLPYYQKFVAKYPTVIKLANASEDEVLKLWQGLGYYSRARNMLITARIIQQECNGKFPHSYNELINLKGIGEYTAAAIASFSNNESVAVVDGNVIRVLSRYFGIFESVDSSLGKKVIKEKANSVLNKKNPGLHNQAIMEFGAIICTPKNPNCVDCPLMKNCVAFQLQKVFELPLKEKKIKIRERYFHYLFIHDNVKTLFKKRDEKDIWKGLFEFPMLEITNPKNEKAELMQFLKNWRVKPTEEIFHVKHILSHQKLHIYFHEIEVKKLPIKKNWEKYELKVKKLPGVPQVILRYLKTKNRIK